MKDTYVVNDTSVTALQFNLSHGKQNESLEYGRVFTHPRRNDRRADSAGRLLGRLDSGNVFGDARILGIQQYSADESTVLAPFGANDATGQRVLEGHPIKLE